MGSNHSSYELRVRAMEAYHRGWSADDIASAYGLHRATIFRWINAYDENGERGLLRKVGGGRPRKLEHMTLTDWRNMMVKPASYHGYETDLWTVRRVQAVLRETHAVTVSKDTVWRRLRDAGLTYQKPERAYYEASEEARQEWVRKEVPKIRRKVTKHRAILYFQDESNVSLTALLGKTWAPRGQTPKVTVTGKRGGVAALSAISKPGRLIFQLHEKRVASDEVIAFLAQMLAHHPRRHLVVVMDQAPPHTSKKTQRYIDKQRRLHIFHLPKYSPDWNPDEKVWNHLKHQELKGHQAKSKAEIKELAEDKLENMSKNPKLLRGLFFRCCVAKLFG